MRPSGAKKELLQRIKASSGALSSLAPQAGIAVMLAFYGDERADGCDPDKDGDMLLYQWGIYPWNGGKFSVNITRQFMWGKGDDDNIRQLSLTFLFKPTKVLRATKSGNRWCQSPGEIAVFHEFVTASGAFRAVQAADPENVELDYGGV